MDSFKAQLPESESTAPQSPEEDLKKQSSGDSQTMEVAPGENGDSLSAATADGKLSLQTVANEATGIQAKQDIAHHSAKHESSLGLFEAVHVSSSTLAVAQPSSEDKDRGLDNEGQGFNRPSVAMQDTVSQGQIAVKDMNNCAQLSPFAQHPASQFPSVLLPELMQDRTMDRYNSEGLLQKLGSDPFGFKSPANSQLDEQMEYAQSAQTPSSPKVKLESVAKTTHSKEDMPILHASCDRQVLCNAEVFSCLEAQ